MSLPAAPAAGSPLTRRRGGGVELAVKATPRAGRSRVEGVVADGAGAAWLACRVAAPAEGGKANGALRELVAKGLGVPAATVEVVAGAASRWKRLRVAGDPAELAARLEALLEAGTDRGR